MSKKDWTQRLHDRLADYEEAAPDDLWQDIERVLDRQAETRRRARILPMTRIAAGAAALLCLVLGGIYVYRSAYRSAENRFANKVQHPTPLAERAVETVKDNSISDYQANIGERQLVKAKSLIAFATSDRELDATQDAVNHDVTNGQLPDEKTLNATQVTADRQTSDSRNENARTQGVVREHPTSASTSSRPNNNSLFHTRPAASQVRHSKLDLMAYASNAVIGQANSNGVLMSESVSGNNDLAEMSYAKRAPIYLTDYGEKEHHHQPISFGLSVRYGLSRRWSVSTGVTYTKVRSDFVHIMGTEQVKNVQTLHYVGVPLTAHYNVWGIKHVKTYVSLGGEADINVKANIATEGNPQPMDKDRVQWSAGASVGVQYDVFPQVGIYAEPGVKYYFDNRSRVRNVFKETPLNFSVQVGLRINVKGI